MGVAPRRLWGWEPTEFHQTVRENGRILGTRVTREPEFDMNQLALLIAADRIQADIGSHGQPMSEATSLQGNPDVAGGWHYEPVGPIVDYAQQRLDKAQAAYERAHPDADTTGHVWRVRRVEG